MRKPLFSNFKAVHFCLSLFVATFFINGEIFATYPLVQGCGASVFPATGTQTPTGAFLNVSAGSNTFVDFNCTMGSIYSFVYSPDSIPGYVWDMTLGNGSAVINYDNNLSPIENSWTGGIGCPITTRPSSAEWYATYTGTVRVNVHSDAGGLCRDWVAGQSSAVIQYKECPSQPDPGPGNGIVNAWNVEAFVTTALDIPNTNARYGYYTDNNSNLDFKTTNYWANNTTPNTAAGWSGCTVSPENFTMRARRLGFPCGVYTFTVNNANDSIGIFVNGTEIFANPCCIVGSTPAGNPLGYVLSANDLVDIRLTAVCSPNQCEVVLTPQTIPPVLAGQIGGVPDGTILCQDSLLGTFTNVTSGSGGTSGYPNGQPIGYDWQVSTDGGGTYSSTGNSTPSWTPAFGIPSGSTFTFRRAALDQCGDTAYSNTITVIGKPSPNASLTPASQTICQGGTAILTLNFNAGTGPFSFTFTDGVNTYSRTGKNNGDTIQVTPLINTTYVFTLITDSYGCGRNSGFTGGAVVALSSGITISNVTSTDVLCNGDSNGIISVSVNGGFPPLYFSDDSGVVYQASSTFNNVPIGNYYIAAHDSLGCSTFYVNNPVVIGQPPAIVVSLSEIDASCANVFDGSITVNASGGATPYTYSLGGPPQSNNVFTGLQAGNYVVSVTDHNGCSDTASITVNNSYTIAVDTISTADISCYGAGNGQIVVQLVGGIPAYEYSLNGIIYQASDTFSGLVAGNYIVIGRDSKGCTQAVDVAITQPAQLAVTLDSINNVLCTGTATGNIYITVTGGTPAYAYNWSNGETSQNDLGVNGGTYTVTVTDSKNCTVESGATVSAPYLLSLNIALFTNPLCNNDSTGQILLQATGGVPPYNYAWNTGAITQDLDSVPGGNYSATVTDANGCQQNISQNLINPTAINDAISGTNVTCYGSNDGSATIDTVYGGTAPYTFLWSNFQSTQSVTGLSAGGLYYVIITDHNGCKKQDTITVNEPMPLVIADTATNISCFNVNDGTINIGVTGGTSPYTYLWNGGQTTQNLSGLSAGTYSITVTDANLCTASASMLIINPTEIVPSAIIKNELCYTDSNGNPDSTGAINIVLFGGTPAYSFLWSNNETTQNIANLPGGTYYLTVTDSRGCKAYDTATVAVPPQFYVSGFELSVTCFGDSNGFIYTSAYGGTPPYYYNWGTLNRNTQNLDSLPAGTYSVRVNDANGCLAQSVYIVHEPPRLALTLSASGNSCYGSCNGVITPTVSGGVPQYSYLWSNFSTGSVLTGLCAGQYALLLTDSNGCRITDTASVTQPGQIVITPTITNVNCGGMTTGAISVVVTGGVQPYAYLWSTGDATTSISNLGPGIYGITITDANNCIQTAVFTVSSSPGLHTTVSLSPPSCVGFHDGFIIVNANGGVQPYTYTWNIPNVNGFTATELAAGTYSVTVTDSLGCLSTASETLNNPPPLTIDVNTTASRCSGQGSGSVVVTLAGDTVPPYHYFLNGFMQTASTFNNLLPGDYLLVAENGKGCFDSTSFTITSPPSISVSVSAPNEGNVILTGMETQLVAVATASDSIIHYFWTPDTLDGEGVLDFSGCTDTSDCSSPFVKPPFTATFTVTVEDADSCFASDTITIYVSNQTQQFIPTAFTPNNDGLNDRFEFDILGANTVEISIFNRWGQRVYYNPNQANGMNETDGWDGTDNGKAAPNDSYVYQMKITYYDGTVKNKTGTVTIIR